MSTIGQNIKYLRNKNKWTQKDLSLRTGIPQGQISDYENNRETPKLDKIKKFALAFNVSVAVIDESLREVTATTADDECLCYDLDQIGTMILKQIKQLTEEQRGEVYAYIQNRYFAVRETNVMYTYTAKAPAPALNVAEEQAVYGGKQLKKK